MKLNQLHTLARTSRVALVAVLALLGTGALHALNFFDNTVAGINLGNASGGSTDGHKGWAVFCLDTLSTNKETTLSGGGINVIGNVAMAALGGSDNLDVSGNSIIQGNVDLAGGAVNLHPGTVTGTITTGDNAYLSQGVTDAINASNAAAALTATAGSPTSIVLQSTSMTITGAANTTYVANLTQLLVSGGSAVLTLVGDSTTNFVFNISSLLTVQGGAHINLAGGLTPANVLYNLKSGAQYGSVGSGGSVLNGIILAPSQTVTVSGDSTVYGEVIAKIITVTGGGLITNQIVSP